jgi:hypothetical protein
VSGGYAAPLDVAGLLRARDSLPDRAGPQPTTDFADNDNDKAADANDALADLVGRGSLGPLPKKEVTSEASARVKRSGARFADFRARARLAEPAEPFYARGETPAALARASADRSGAASAQTWVQPATGVVYLAPAYTAARDTAHAFLSSRADHLAPVPIGMFIRDAPSGSVQKLVRSHFGRLIATFYNIGKDESNRSSKFAHDMRNLTAEANTLLAFFSNRITFDPRTEEFHDTGRAGALSNRRLDGRNGPTSFAPIRYPPTRTPVFSSLVARPLAPFSQRAPVGYGV